jgi:hypothetical protein
MAGIDEVLERLVAEPEFREQLRADPAVALSDYVLDVEDLEVLAFTLDESDGGEHAVEPPHAPDGRVRCCLREAISQRPGCSDPLPEHGCSGRRRGG